MFATLSSKSILLRLALRVGNPSASAGRHLNHVLGRLGSYFFWLPARHAFKLAASLKLLTQRRIRVEELRWKIGIVALQSERN